MQTDELREKYLEFFESKGCVRRPSDVLVPKWDPTVLFTPAGMNQFKEQFLGIGKIDFTRATTCQKCLRTGDIDNVGVTSYHQTFFEMLGNFSFGDYFKRDAINWAWEFLTGGKWLGIPGDQLSATVYLDDDEAAGIWANDVGLPSERIVREDEDENFWPASAPSQGPDGVCGPCSEIYFHPSDGSEPVEIWNLVFTQFNRAGDPPDNLTPLPSKNIDTGMGLERTAAVLQGKTSNYEIDILRPLCEAVAETVGVTYEFSAKTGRPVRRIADHLRAVTFCLHEEVTTDSKGAGYIVRLLLRRAFLEGYLLGRNEPFLHQLVPSVVAQMKTPYPELADNAETVAEGIRLEEEHFLKTVDRGLSRYRKVAEQAKASGGVIPGDIAFDLHQTDGFVIDLTRSLAERDGLKVDLKGFEQAEEKHADVSRGGGFEGVMAAGPLEELRIAVGDTTFLGYETTEAETTLVGIVASNVRGSEITAGAEAVVVLSESPFYGEAGGQVGDSGTITSPGGTFAVLDTQKKGEFLMHLGRVTAGVLKEGEPVTASVDGDRRAGIRRAHSATHLLHHALRNTLGENATQRGSKVEQDVLRFDFSHGSAVGREELLEIEDEINLRVAEGATVDAQVMPLEDAKRAGAMALFGEKYPDEVRVVSMGDYSRELCGGTHLSNTGQVGLCKIISEESVSAGVRRVTALTGAKALDHVRSTENLLREVATMVKAPQPDELLRRVTSLLDELKAAKQELQAQRKKNVSGVIDDLLSSAETIGETKIVSHLVENATRESLRGFVDPLRGKGGSVAIILGAEIDGKVALLAAVTDDLIKRGVTAPDAVRAAAKVAGGGGGGRPNIAEAGGSRPDQIPAALEEAVRVYREKLSNG